VSKLTTLNSVYFHGKLSTMQKITLALVAFVCLFGISAASNCYDVTKSCSMADFDASSCKTNVGRYINMDTSLKQDKDSSLNRDTQNLIQEHIRLSTEYLLMASHFNEWSVNRQGFHNYFLKLSDEKWQQGIDLLKYSIIRGGEITPDFNVPVPSGGGSLYKMYELPALAKALDLEKRLTTDILSLAHRATLHTSTTHANLTVTNNNDNDGAFSYYLNEDVSHNKVPRIKDLSNHINTLAVAMKSTNDPAFVLYIYDNNVLV